MTMTDLPAVGFVGLGDQGLPIAQAIADSGFPLRVWARHQHSLQGLSGFAFTAADDVAALGAGSDVVALCLPEDADLVELVTTGGLLNAMSPGSILLTHGTGLPSTVRHLAEIARPRQVTVVDAPVSGGHTVAVARQLTTIVGGPDEAVARLRPLFATFSKEVIHLGPTGFGQFGKLFNNTVMMMNRKNVIDALTLGTAVGLAVPGLVEVLRAGSASSAALTAFGPSITYENAAHLQELERTDLGLFVEAVGDLGDAAGDVVGRARAGVDALTDLTPLIVN